MSKTLKPDKQWFQENLKRKNYTFEKAAKEIGLSKSQFSRVMSGHRRLQYPELATLSHLLATTPEKVVKALGLVTPAATSKNPRVKLIGHFNEQLAMVEERGKDVICPFEGKGIVAAQLRTLQSRYSAWEGGTIFFQEPVSFDRDCRGALSVVRVLGEKTFKLRTPQKGYSDPGGSFGPHSLCNLAGTSGETLEEGVRLDIVAKVLGIVL